MLDVRRSEVEKKASISATTTIRLDSLGREEEDVGAELLVLADSSMAAPFDGGMLGELSSVSGA